MSTIYRPPFAPYCQRQEAKDPNPALRRPWDGCWCWTLARSIDGATGGKVHGLAEHDVRVAAGKPDHPGVSDGGTIDDQVRALQKLAPKGTWYSARPTTAEFTAHLAAGGIAVVAGWESNAPRSDRTYDPAFYDRTGKNGHSNFCQGVGDGANVLWGNPEKPVTDPEPVVTIAAVLAFVWRAKGGRVEALLLRSATLAAPKPAPTPAPVRTNMIPSLVVTVSKPGTIAIVMANTNLREAPDTAVGKVRRTTTAVERARLLGSWGDWRLCQFGADALWVHVSRVGGTEAAAPDSTPYSAVDLSNAVLAARNADKARAAKAAALIDQARASVDAIGNP